MGVIDVICPVLDRPGNAPAVVGSYLETGGTLDSFHFICSPHDAAEISACRSTGANVILTTWKPGKGDYARKVNLGYRSTSREFLFFAADDVEFLGDWSDRALRAMEGHCVVATNDLCNAHVRAGLFGTHCLVRRSYIDDPGASADGPGYLLHEGYDHNFVDRELCGLARHRGVYAFAPKAWVRHNHPMTGRATPDKTYAKGIARFQSDRRLFYARAAKWNYEGMSPYERRASTTPQGRRHGRYSARR